MADKKPISKDQAWLDDLVKNNQYYANQTAVKQALTPDEALAKQQQEAEQETEQETVTDRKDATRVTSLQERADRLNAGNQKRIEREQQKIDERKAAIAQREQEEQQGQIQATTKQVARSVSSGVTTIADRVGSVQTVGGIGLLLAILILLVFAIVQVNSAGDTRLKQLWYMLNGRATLTGAVVPSGVIGGGAAGPYNGQPVPGGVGGFAPQTATFPTVSANTGTAPIVGNYRTITAV